MAVRGSKKFFYDLVSRAIDEFLRYGFDSQVRLEEWLKRLYVAAREALVPEAIVERMMRESLTSIFQRLMKGGALGRKHRGIPQYTLAAIRPKLRAELDRRILASANLIKLNREDSIQRTLRRFAGWATSIPLGGTRAAKRAEANREMRRAFTSLPFIERRVIVDQGHKLTASIHEIVAIDGGAIAGIWHSRWREIGYDYREDHKDRDRRIYVIRNNWALKRGLMRLAGREYTDQITQPAEEVFCRCHYEYLYTLRDLPPDMLTTKGREELVAARARLSFLLQ